MEMSDYNHIQALMLRYLNHESSNEESRALELWINESNANAEEFELVKNIWEDSADSALIPVDVEKAWQKVQSQTIVQEAKVVKMFPWKKVFMVAASIIIAAGVFYFSYQSTETVWKETLAQNSNKKIQLTDGSIITLRVGSKISIPENYNKSRQVKLEGEAYFEVHHDVQNPFSVISSKSIIQDIGTAFLIQSNDSIEQVTVMEGEISFTNKKEKKNLLILKAGETAYLKNETLQRKNADTTNLLSWESKILIFQNKPLSQVVKDLEHFYKIHVQMENQLGQIEITAEFRNETLAQVVKELKLFTGLNFRLEKDQLIISK